MTTQDSPQERRLREVAHELRTPLTHIRGYGELAQFLLGQICQQDTGPLEERLSLLTTFHAKLLAQIEQMEQLLTDLNAPQQAPSWQAELFDLIPLAREVMLAHAPLVPARRLVLEAQEEENPPPRAQVIADPRRIRQVVSNLLNNALHYSAGTVIVTVRVHQEEGLVHVAVQDAGMGVAEHSLPHIWEEGYRASEARALRAEGAGIGLFLCKEWVEQAGGKIGVQSRFGQGSTFWFHLPLATSTVS